MTSARCGECGETLYHRGDVDRLMCYACGGHVGLSGGK